METRPIVEKNRVRKIVSLHNQIISDLKRSLDSAIQIGQLLSEQKENLGHGEFGPWIKSNLPFTDRTARNYMRCYRERDLLKNETVSDLKSAYKLLEEPKEKKMNAGEVDILALRTQRAAALKKAQNAAEELLDIDVEIGKAVSDYPEESMHASYVKLVECNEELSKIGKHIEELQTNGKHIYNDDMKLKEDWEETGRRLINNINKGDTHMSLIHQLGTQTYGKLTFKQMLGAEGFAVIEKAWQCINKIAAN